MASAVQLYEALATAPDDKTRAKLIAEAIERLEERYPHLPDLTTRAHLRETEFCLRKEIRTGPFGPQGRDQAGSLRNRAGLFGTQNRNRER